MFSWRCFPFVESAPRAYRLKASNAAPSSSTSTGTIPVQKALQLVFDTFERTGSAMETVRYFRQHGLLFARRPRIGPNKGDLLWALPQHAPILQVLPNPRYAGTFAYGRTRIRICQTAAPRWSRSARPTGSSSAWR